MSIGISKRASLLVVRRLAIVDLQGGRQLLSNERQNVWVAFNGELFDYAELFAELQGKLPQHALRYGDLAASLRGTRGRDVRAGRTVRGVLLWDADKRTLLWVRRSRRHLSAVLRQVRRLAAVGFGNRGVVASGLVSPRPDRRGMDHFFCFYSTGATGVLPTAFAR